MTTALLTPTGSCCPFVELLCLLQCEHSLRHHALEEQLVHRRSNRHFYLLNCTCTSLFPSKNMSHAADWAMGGAYMCSSDRPLPIFLWIEWVWVVGQKVIGVDCALWVMFRSRLLLRCSLLRGRSSSQLTDARNFQAIARISSSARLQNESKDKAKGDSI